VNQQPLSLYFAVHSKGVEDPGGCTVWATHVTDRTNTGIAGSYPARSMNVNLHCFVFSCITTRLRGAGRPGSDSRQRGSFPSLPHPNSLWGPPASSTISPGINVVGA
jgi:hypothetical protein